MQGSAEVGLDVVDLISLRCWKVDLDGVLEFLEYVQCGLSDGGIAIFCAVTDYLHKNSNKEIII